MGVDHWAAGNRESEIGAWSVMEELRSERIALRLPWRSRSIQSIRLHRISSDSGQMSLLLLLSGLAAGKACLGACEHRARPNKSPHRILILRPGDAGVLWHGMMMIGACAAGRSECLANAPDTQGQ